MSCLFVRKQFQLLLAHCGICNVLCRLSASPVGNTKCFVLGFMPELQLHQIIDHLGIPELYLVTWCWVAGSECAEQLSQTVMTSHNCQEGSCETFRICFMFAPVWNMRDLNESIQMCMILCVNVTIRISGSCRNKVSLPLYVSCWRICSLSHRLHNIPLNYSEKRLMLSGIILCW